MPERPDVRIVSEYMYSVELPRVGFKTRFWTIRNTRSDDTLGFVRWHAGWRQYVFEPEWSTAPIFNGDCLDAIRRFLDAAQDEQRASRKSRQS